jgi:hypothetical protein
VKPRDAPEQPREPGGLRGEGLTSGVELSSVILVPPKLALDPVGRERLVPRLVRTDGGVEARFAVALALPEDAERVALLVRVLPRGHRDRDRFTSRWFHLNGLAARGPAPGSPLPGLRAHQHHAGCTQPPARAVPAARQMSEAERALRTAYEQLVAAGLPPAQVAERVLAAIREERFWIFPHPELLEGVRLRMQTILAQQNPTLALPEEMRAMLKL